MRAGAVSSERADDSEASELLRSLASGDTTLDPSTRDALHRLLSDGSEPVPESKAATPAKPVSPQSAEAMRRSGLAYVRRLRISAR